MCFFVSPMRNCVGWSLDVIPVQYCSILRQCSTRRHCVLLCCNISLSFCWTSHWIYLLTYLLFQCIAVLVALSHCIDGSISRHWQKLQSLTKLVAQSFC